MRHAENDERYPRLERGYGYGDSVTAGSNSSDDQGDPGQTRKEDNALGSGIAD